MKGFTGNYSFALSGFLLRSGAGIEQPKTLFVVIPTKAGIYFQELHKMLVYKKVQKYRGKRDNIILTILKSVKSWFRHLIPFYFS
ncbi:MAG: hypothetical protein HQL06_05580 [Nitrospirae bacterium]|nr:hypothetical protein [Nitrospirota bacterium]